MIIYMDNFRGFKNTHLSFEDVNFFVGENSTGKSSVLGLLNLLSNYKFWLYHSFNTEEYKFGHFDDIVSIYSKDRSYFKIGVCGSDTTFGNGFYNFPKNKAHLFIYTEYEGSPRLSEYFYFDGKYEIHVVLDIKRDKQAVFYSLRKRGDVTSDKDIYDRVFMPWTRKKYNLIKSNKLKLLVPSSKSKRRSIRINPPVEELLSHIDEILFSESNKEEELEWIHPFIISDFYWLAPIRSAPRRTYDEYKTEYTPEGEHTPYIVRKYLKHNRNLRDEFVDFLNRIGKNSGLFESISVKEYGENSTSPFELDVTLNKKTLSINNVGYGVSQALPIIVEIFSRQKGSCYGIQQPEVHLHPRAQAALGSMIYEFVRSDKKQFIIETHSDYLIDRYRIHVRSSRGSAKQKAQIIFFERSFRGNKLYRLSIDENGGLPSEQPKGYREFFIKEEFNLLGIE